MGSCGSAVCADSWRPSYRVRIFFFQAEDGIRYLIVTGVQTCALPISLFGRLVFERRRPDELLDRLDAVHARGLAVVCLAGGHDLPVGRNQVETKLARRRSEERRVGKECRSRWSPYH